MSKFEVGDNVVPISKSTHDRLDQCLNWKKAQERKQPFLYVNKIHLSGMKSNVIACHVDNNEGYMWATHYLESDLVPYVEPIKEPRFKPGDKVVPVSKTVPGHTYDINDEQYWKVSKERGYFYVNELRHDVHRLEGELIYLCNDGDDCPGGNYYLESDLIPYVEPKPEVKEEQVFKIGDKVVPHGKSWGDSFEDWKNDVKHAPYYVVERVWENGDVGIEHGVFKSYDLTFYVEPTLPINHCPQNKTMSGYGCTLPDFIHVPIKTIFNGPATICIFDYDGKQFKGISKCNPADNYNVNIGHIIACERATIELSKYRIAQAAKQAQVIV